MHAFFGNGAGVWHTVRTLRRKSSIWANRDALLSPASLQSAPCLWSIKTGWQVRPRMTARWGLKNWGTWVKHEVSADMADRISRMADDDVTKAAGKKDVAVVAG